MCPYLLCNILQQCLCGDFAYKSSFSICSWFLTQLIQGRDDPPEPLLELSFPLSALGWMFFLFSPLKSAPTPGLELRWSTAAWASLFTWGFLSFLRVNFLLCSGMRLHRVSPKTWQVGVCCGKKFKLKNMILDRSLPLLRPSSFPVLKIVIVVIIVIMCQ